MPVFSIRGTFSIRRKGLYIYIYMYICMYTHYFRTFAIVSKYLLLGGSESR